MEEDEEFKERDKGNDYGILPVIRESVKYIFLLTTNTIGILQ